MLRWWPFIRVVYRRKKTSSNKKISANRGCIDLKLYSTKVPSCCMLSLARSGPLYWLYLDDATIAEFGMFSFSIPKGVAHSIFGVSNPVKLKWDTFISYQDWNGYSDISILGNELNLSTEKDIYLLNTDMLCVLLPSSCDIKSYRVIN